MFHLWFENWWFTGTATLQRSHEMFWSWDHWRDLGGREKATRCLSMYIYMYICIICIIYMYYIYICIKYIYISRCLLTVPKKQAHLKQHVAVIWSSLGDDFPVEYRCFPLRYPWSKRHTDNHVLPKPSSNLRCQIGMFHTGHRSQNEVDCFV